MKKLFFFPLLFLFSFTTDGQMILKDIIAGNGSASHAYPIYDYVDQYVVFETNTTSFGYEIWKSDATEAGTVLIDEVGVEGFLATPDKFYYMTSSKLFVSNGPGNSVQLYETDEDPYFLYQLGDKVLMIDNLYDVIDIISTDGTLAGTAKTASMPIYVQDLSASEFDGKLILTDASFSQDDFDAIITDGTTAGTMFLTDFIKTLGINDMEVKNAFGTGDALVLEKNRSIKIYHNSAVTDHTITGDLKNVITAGNWLLIHSDYYVYGYNKETKEIVEMPIQIDGFSKITATDCCFYYVANNGTVHEFNIADMADSVISAVMVGTNNSDTDLKINNGWLYYSERLNSTYKIRRIELTTKVDEFLDDVYESTGLIPDIAVAFVNNKVVYNKFTEEYGWEWWVTDGSMKTPVKRQNLSASVWPNQVKELLFYKSSDGHLKNAMIFDSAGKMIDQFSLNQNEGQINVDHLINGIYYVRLMNKDGRMATFKVVKE